MNAAGGCGAVTIDDDDRQIAAQFESANSATVELGEGIRATCRITKSAAPAPEAGLSGKADLSSLSNMLQARWKGSAPAPSAAPEPLRAGQIRSFKITKLDAESKSIEVQVA